MSLKMADGISTGKYHRANTYLLASVLVFLMQCGFGMLEAGSVRRKNTSNILLKNLSDTCVLALCWWLVGYGFAFGEGSPVIGLPTASMLESGVTSDPDEPIWFHQFTFAAASITIVSGAIAERTQFVAYLMISLTGGALVYPVVAHWYWSRSGWLSPFCPTAYLGGAIDFAGGAVVLAPGNARA